MNLFSALIIKRINYYGTSNPNKLILIINKAHKNTFDIDKLWEACEGGSRFKTGYIESPMFTAQAFTDLCDEFEDKFSDCIINSTCDIEDLIIDMLLLVRCSNMAIYIDKNADQGKSDGFGSLNNMFNNFMNSTKF